MQTLLCYLIIFANHEEWKSSAIATCLSSMYGDVQYGVSAGNITTLVTVWNHSRQVVGLS